ncbi:hypothetical protein ACHAW5_000147 [Stephanodiscus triporus]|uniref:endo-1,4-beta-xylanase n=1 Tax=Stephanodiscus triporus TaxID=2934178 RepID=A0ABD3NML2_9STRA
MTTTLRETAARCRREVYIGAAVLPRPLFVMDFDDDGDGVRPRIGCATISTVDPGGGGRGTPTNDGGASTTTTTTTTTSTTTDIVAAAPTTTRYARVLSSEFNSVVIEHHLKWSPLVHSLPGPVSQDSPPETRLGRYDFRHVDDMVDWAVSNDMHVKGHVLVWHVTSPPFLEDMSPEDVRGAVKRHIFATMGYFRDRIRMWDVVNEALADDGTLVENVFYRKMGPGYVEECFRWAHEADPDAYLIYNDNKVEGCGYRGGRLERDGPDDDDDGGGGGTASSPPGEDDAAAAAGRRRRKARAPNQAKADGYYDLLKSLVERNVPIHGAGMQAHFDASGTGRNRPPTPSMVKRQIRRIGELGLGVNISEMDVRVSRLRRGVDRDAAQTTIYRDVLRAALSEPSFSGIWLWGFSDRHTWVKNFYHDDSPLIFDDAYERKSAYRGVEEALRSICPGGGNDDDGGGDGAWYLEADYDESGNEWGCDWMVPEPTSEEGEGGNGVRTESGRDTTREGQPDWLLPS